MKALFIISLFAFSLVLPAQAATKKIGQSTLPNGLVVQEYQLDNGMQILLIPDHSAPVFTYQVWFKVGSAKEKLDPKLNRTGLAHLFEHMMFRGTPKVPDKVFDQKLLAAGAVGENATTWLDRTNYFESLPRQHLELVFFLESDRMANLKLTDDLFQTERGAVYGEYKMNMDKPIRKAYEILWENAFEKHPYKWSTMGKMEELKSFTVQDAQYFYKTYYAPNNATLILIGDFQTANALALAEKYYGPMKKQNVPNIIPPAETEQTKARQATAEHPLATNNLMLIGYKIPNINHEDIAALDVASAILGYGDGSLLQKTLVEEGMATSVSADVYKLRDPSLFIFTIQVAKDKSDSKAKDIFQDQIAKLKKGNIDSQELERARNQYLLFANGELNSQSNIGSNIGEALVSSDNYRRNFEILDAVKKVTLADVARVSQKYFVEEKSTTVVITPAKGGK